MRIVSDGFHRMTLFFILWVSPLLLFAQKELPNQVLPSPIAMQFQKYGDYPVSYYTGIPDIKVPIYTIKEGDIEVPIYLSFHASGLNLNEDQGIVGYGWTLNTGGVISRTINGFADESPPYVGIPDLESMYFGYYPDFESMQFICNETDHEYDVYNYTTPNHSGKYIPNFFREGDMFGEYGYNFMFKADNIRIYPGNQITDEKGINYYFGGEGAEEYQEFSTLNNPGTAGAVSSWYLGAIVSSLHPGMGISYQYQAGPVLNVNKQRKTWKLDDYYITDKGFDETDDHHRDIINSAYPYNPGGIYGFFSYVNNPYMRNYESVVPQKITFSEGYLKFYVDSYKHLQKIEIYNKKNELLRTVNLVLENFNPWTLPSKYRKLKSVTFQDADGGNVETYSFNYYHESTQIDTHSGRDHWGFYNGAYLSGTDNHTMSYNYPYQYFDIINHSGTVNYGQTGYDRNPVPNYAKTFMLQKMTYPTGGYTIFDYEGNQLGYNDPSHLEPLQLVGGLRIKQISSYGHDDQLLKSKQYAYKSNWQTESGVDNAPGKLYQEHAVVDGDGSLARRVSIYEDIPLNLFPKGAPIGYYEVKETEGAATTTYVFDDEDAYTYTEVKEPGVFNYGPTGEFFFKRMAHGYKPWSFGNLVSKEIKGPGVERIEYYTYQDSILRTVYDWNMYQNIFASIGGTSTYHSFTSDFNYKKRYYYSGFKRLKEKYVSEEGNDGIAINSTEKYSYGNSYYPLQMSSKRLIESRGDTIKTDYKYANNYLSAEVYHDMDLKNMTAEVLEETQTNLSQSKELKKIKRDYAYFRPSPTDSAMIQLKSIRSSVGGAALDTLVKVERYDNKGRILQYRGRDQQPVSYLYFSSYSYPVAKLLGATYSEVSAILSPTYYNISFNESVLVSYLTNRFKLYLPQTQFSVYTYILGVGVKTETDTRGRTTNYEYDSFQRLKLVRDHEGKIVNQYNYHLKPSTP